MRSDVLATEFRTKGPLARPLRFGDAEQIKALKQWRAAIEAEEAAEAENAERASGDAVEWEVTYTVERSRTVLAVSKEQAEDVLREEEIDDIEDILYVERVRQ